MINTQEYNKNIEHGLFFLFSSLLGSRTQNGAILEYTKDRV